MAIRIRELYSIYENRVGMPVVVYGNGNKSWLFNKKLHRVNGQSYWYDGYHYLFDRRISINIDKLVI